MRAGASNTHGVFPVSEEIDALIADARRAGADLLGCDPGEIVFGQNATSLLLHLSRSIATDVGTGRRDRRHEARPRRERASVGPRRPRRRRDRALGGRARGRRHARPRRPRRAAIGQRTKLVAFTLASNAVGTMPPAAERGRAREGRSARSSRSTASTSRSTGRSTCTGSAPTSSRPRRTSTSVRTRAWRRCGQTSWRRSSRTSSAPRPTRTPTGGNPARRATRRSPGRSPRSTTSPRWAGAATGATAIRRGYDAFEAHERSARARGSSRGWPRSPACA